MNKREGDFGGAFHVVDNHHINGVGSSLIYQLFLCVQYLIIVHWQKTCTSTSAT